MRVLVTGATGFLGSQVAKQLIQHGHEVRVLVRTTSNRSGIAGLKVEEVIGDVTDPKSLNSAVSGMDAVVHSAARVSARTERELEAANSEGTKNLVDAMDAVAPNAKMIYISSLAAAGPSADGNPVSESMPSVPVSHYGRSKLHGEEHIQNWRGHDNAIILRPPVIYGPGDMKLLSLFRLARWRLAPLLAGGRNRVATIFIDDAAEAIVKATESDIGGRTYFISDGVNHTWLEIHAAVEAAIGRRVLRVPVPRWSLMTAAMAAEVYGSVRRLDVPLTRQKAVEMTQADWICTNASALVDFQWAPKVDLLTGSKLAVEWYRSNGLL